MGAEWEKDWENSDAKAAQDETDKALAMLENPVVGMRVIIGDGEFETWERFEGDTWSIRPTCVNLYDWHALPLLRAAVEGGRAKVVMP